MVVKPQLPAGQELRRLLDHLLLAVRMLVRETDLVGWQKDGASLGVIFTEIKKEDERQAVASIPERMCAFLKQSVGEQHYDLLEISFHLFPDNWNEAGTDKPTTSILHQHPRPHGPGGRTSMLAKRAIDIAGSITAILFFAPIMLAIAIGIKLTSPGPILFRQTRVGQFGRRFTFLKFRSMRTQNDPEAHRAYMKSYIEGKKRDEAVGAAPVYKMVNDPRITPFGRWIRKTSLDELPQLFNVLSGEMSLVGPRPPIEYEVDNYRIWHRRRLLVMKPGITGLWQVSGRSKVGFDDMVRLDLRYARSWSLLLDLEILVRTPLAVLRAEGAY